MSLHLNRFAVPGLLALALAPCLQAQDSPMEVQFKLHTGLALNQPKNDTTRKLLGIGLELGYDTSFGRFSGELGYLYKPGDQHQADVSTFPVAQGAAPADPASSVDSRKNQLEGLTLRLAFARPITTGCSWQGGLQVGGSKYRQEYIADVADANWATYEDTYNGAITHTTVSVSPFAGLAFKVNQVSTLEVNLLGLSYTSANYVHVVGTIKDENGGHTSQDTVALKRRMVPHVELAYGIQF